MVCSGFQENPGDDVGTMKIEMPLCFLTSGVGARREPDVVGVRRAAGEHLLAVDDVVVAVAHGGGAQRRQIGARRRLGVADRELDVAVQDRGQELLLLLLGAAMRERRPDGVEGDERDRRVHPLRLVEEDELLERGKAPSAILFGPADAEQVGGAERSHALLDGVAALHAACDRGDAFGRHHRSPARTGSRCATASARA